MQADTKESIGTMNVEEQGWKQTIVRAASFLIIILFLFSTAAPSFAGTDVSTYRSEVELLPSTEKVVTELGNKLQLNDQQLVQITPIMEEFHSKVMQLLSTQPDERNNTQLKSPKGQLIALYRVSARQLKDILTSDQLALYTEYMKGLLTQDDVLKAMQFSMLSE